MDTPLEINSISQIHKMMGGEKPKHPLITVFQTSEIQSEIDIDPKRKILSNLYAISLKTGEECEILYGRKHYDFQEGSLMFFAPSQIILPLTGGEKSHADPWSGWLLLFHPDLIRSSALGKKIGEYSFFLYASHEALQLSELERQTVTTIVRSIKREYSQNLDNHSHELIISNLELLLNYCKRFYGRQFITRSHVNKDVVIRFESLLNAYLESQTLEYDGLPSVAYCAEQMGYSPNYLSDLLKKETGKSALEHIHFHLIERAKDMLLGTEEPIYRIALLLGFRYPQYFTKLFKQKTGMTPTDYRQ